MKATDFHRRWEEAEMDLRMLEAEVARMGVSVAKVRRIHEDIYEGMTGRPAPLRERQPVERQRRVAS